MPTSSLRSVSATRLISAVTAIGLFVSAGSAAANPKMVIDARTGKVIAHEDAFLKWYPASLTKLMTAYVTFKALKSGRLTLDTPIVMSKKATDQPASKMYFKPGSKLTMDSALKILLVKSANDVAVAVAETVGGSLDQFVAMMNSQAQALGMTSTRYINPHGLPGKGQYSTARDLALLTLRLKQDFPEYQSYFSLEGIDTGAKQYPNFNTLIGRFDGADGMKTGFICASGFNQVGSATRDGRTVISVVLGSDSLAGRADDTANLLQQGLTSPPSQGVPLTSLQPYGDMAEVNDVSATICNPQAAKVRSETRDDAGRTVQHSPYIHEMDRPPVYSFAGLIPGSEQIASTKGKNEIANVPIPQPRPTF
ncbi:D-alanyl-D-alanine carboxypeptidase family protein [Neorhizobium sp. T25_13]|uniref:D-alanyl-D-alanine carboxypeptidase family protein n=1 Tax=Neorhizobium sp. T25_13 TaxID=2093830 RepID=UPI000CF94D3B|nr:D-alanyl-D-alanine carboxypeptidase family protein [Neorhizobium sp. T25_13]